MKIFLASILLILNLALFSQCINDITDLNLQEFTLNAAQPLAGNDESGLARNVYNQDELFIINQNGTIVKWNTLTSTKQTLPGVDIGGATYYDFEGLSYLFYDAGEIYAAVSENQGKIFLFTILQTGIGSYIVVEKKELNLKFNGSNKLNLEGITYDPNEGRLYLIEESNPRLYKSAITFKSLNELPANNGNLNINLVPLSSFSATAFSGGHHLAQGFGCSNFQPYNNHILILSQESTLVYEFDLSTTPASLVGTLPKSTIAPFENVKLEGVEYYNNKLHLIQDNDANLNSSTTNFVFEDDYKPLFNIDGIYKSEKTITTFVNFDDDVLTCNNQSKSNYYIAYRPISNSFYQEVQFQNDKIFISNLTPNTYYEIALYNKTQSSFPFLEYDCKSIVRTINVNSASGGLNQNCKEVLELNGSIVVDIYAADDFIYANGKVRKADNVIFRAGSKNSEAVVLNAGFEIEPESNLLIYNQQCNPND